MQIKWTINFRKFTSPEERRDSGYYHNLDKNKKGIIDVNAGDTSIEQIMTLYHEVTHAIFDILVSYKFNKKRKRMFRRNPKLKEAWRTHNEKANKEEIICRKVERAIKRVFAKELSPEFWNEFFKDEK